MKKNILYSMLIALVAFTFASCGDKESEGKSRFTFYPTIELLGEASMNVDKGTAYVEPGFTSTLNGEDVSDKVTVTGTVDTSKSGVYTLTYTTTTNSDGFSASATRTVIVLDPNSAVEGFYLNSPTSYRLREGAQVAYGAAFELLVIDNGDGTYSVDDMLGGWYRDRAGYGSNYAMQALISIAEDGNVTLMQSYVPGWGDSHDDFTGTFDAATGTFNFDVVYAAMNFVQTWVKE